MVGHLLEQKCCMMKQNCLILSFQSLGLELFIAPGVAGEAASISSSGIVSYSCGRLGRGCSHCYFCLRR